MSSNLSHISSWWARWIDTQRSSGSDRRISRKLPAYIIAVGAVVLTLLIRLFIDEHLKGQAALVIFTIPIMLSAYVGGMGPGLLATVLSYVSANYFFLPPYHSFNISSGAEMWQLGIVLLAGIVISALNGALHNAKERAAVATKQNLAAEKFADATLKENNDLRAALDEHAIVAVTDAKGKITFINDKFCTISGYSREELLGRDHRIINSGHHPREFMQNLWATISVGKVWHGEIKNRAKDGSFYWVDTTIVPFLDHEGKPTQYIAIRADISERKRVEQELQSLNVELEQRVHERTEQLQFANKELESFSYSVSHDLRSPLRAVDGFSLAVLEDYGSQLPDEGRRYLQTIRDGAQKMAALIDDLLTFSRLQRQAMRRTRVDTLTLVKGATKDLLDQELGRSIQVKMGELPPCEGDPALLKQVWMNLLSNAIKYTRSRSEAVIKAGSLVEDGKTVFFVRDNGTGFDMRYESKLFGVFQRLHRAEDYEGTGVGLAIVQRIIHRHGGRVWADAKLGEGATFFFTLGSAD